MPTANHFWRDPALPFIEGRRTVGSLSCYAPHTHHTLSIGIVDAGRSTLTLSGQRIPIAPGDVVVVRPGEVHSCNPDDLQRWSYRMFHIAPTWRPDVQADLPSQVVREPLAVRLLDRMSVALDHDHADKHDEVQACLSQLVRLCASSHATPATYHRAHDLERAYCYLQTHCLERVDLDTLARIANIGRYQLIRGFRRHYGLTPHALQLDMRINLARLLLQRGRGATETAYDTGFADQSHFHRIFKSRVAATPAQYRNGR